MGKAAETMKRIAVGLLASALWALPVYAQDSSPIRDQDRSNFDTLYAEKLSRVDRTRATADDNALATDMFDFAQGLPDTDAGAKCLVYAELITLSSNTGDLGLMRDALGLLETIWPGQDLVSHEVLMQRANRAYRTVARNDREEQGEHYIAMLMGIAQQYENENDPEQAIGVCRLASTIANTIKSDQFAPIQDKLGRLASASDIANRIKMLERSVQKNPQNSPAARELVKLLITEHSDIQAAAKFVESTRDEELIDLVQRCALGIDDANAATAMRVGDWYIALAEDERDRKAIKLLYQSRDWYEQFFALYRRDDALAKRAAEMNNLALLKIERMVEDNPALAKTPKDGWFPLIAPPFDPDKQKLGRLDVFEVDRGEITIDNGALFIPFKRGKAYEVRLTVTVHDDAQDEMPAISLYLPVSDNRVILTRCHAIGGTLARVDRIGEDRLLKDLPDRIGQKMVLTFQVAELSGQVAFAMLYQGKPAIQWQGEREELKALDKEQRARLPAEVGPVMLLRCFEKLTIHAVDYKERG